MKQLIITSDDFGLSAGVNAAVEKGWQNGILTCASIMPGGTAFQEAVTIAKRNPGLQVGLHLTLLHGHAVLSQKELGRLVNTNGEFSDNPVLSGIRYYFDKSLHKAVESEIETQIKHVLNAGIPLTHIDGHLNIHLHPTVFAILEKLMPRYGIKSFRLSQERLFHNLRFDRTRITGKLFEKITFGLLAAKARQRLQELKISYAGEVKGVLNSGRMTEPYLLNILNGLQDGVTEIYFHPGVLPDSEISRRMPDYRHQEELAAITSASIRQKLAELKIDLINYNGEIKQNA